MNNPNLAYQRIFPALLVDIGNSGTKWLLSDFDGSQLALGKISHDCTPIETSKFESLPRPLSAWVSNVASSIIYTRLQVIISKYWPGIPIQIVQAKTKQSGVRNGYSEPSQLGSDRWASLVGARATFPNETILIVTLGTATTLELLEDNGFFRGGLIVPGFSLMKRALGEYTARLSTSPIPEERKLDIVDLKQIFANETARAIELGCCLSQVSFIERIWQVLYRDMFPTRKLRCILSGGAVNGIVPILKIPYTRCDNLVLIGLYKIAKDTAIF